MRTRSHALGRELMARNGAAAESAEDCDVSGDAASTGRGAARHLLVLLRAVAQAPQRFAAERTGPQTRHP